MIRYLSQGIRERSVGSKDVLFARDGSSRFEQTGHGLRVSLDAFDFVRLERLRVPVDSLFPVQRPTSGQFLERGELTVTNRDCPARAVSTSAKVGKGGSAPDGEEPLDKVMPRFQLVPIPSQLVLQFLALCPPRPRRLPVLIKPEVGVETRRLGWGLEERVVQEEIEDVVREREGEVAAADLGVRLFAPGRARWPGHDGPPLSGRGRLGVQAQGPRRDARTCPRKKRNDGGRKERGAREETRSYAVCRERGCLSAQVFGRRLPTRAGAQTAQKFDQCASFNFLSRCQHGTAATAYMDSTVRYSGSADRLLSLYILIHQPKEDPIRGSSSSSALGSE